MSHADRPQHPEIAGRDPRRVVPPEAFVFDFDGTLIDTEDVEYRSLARLWAGHGLSLPYEEWAAYIGLESPDWPGYLLGMLPQRYPRTTIERELAACQDRLTADQPLRAGVLGLLDGARELGIPVGIASNGHRSRVIAELERRGLLNEFAAVVTGEDVDRGKPDPDCYVTVARVLDITPSSAIAFEDSGPGLEAARAAGFRCVVAPTPATLHHDLRAADLLVGEFSEVSVPDLLEGRLQKVSIE